MSTGKTVALLARLKNAKRLPSPPGTALRVLELCRRDNVDVREIADVVMADPALSGRLLRYANSAVVGAGREVVSVRDAVLCLGLRTVKLAALGFSLACGMESDCGSFGLKRFWTESVLTAIVARRFAATFGADREESFTAGLLLGIGKLALACGIPEEYAQVQIEAPVDCAALIEAERRYLGTDHLEFGGALLTQWAVPMRLIKAIVHHLNPAEVDAVVQPLARTIQIAAALSPLFLPGADPPTALRQAARTAVEVKLKLDPKTWQQAAEQTLADYHQVASLFEVELDQASVFDLYAEAQEEAMRVGIVAQLERSQALKENQDLPERATTDPLTGIANRATFDQRLQELVGAASRGGGHFALVIFDIDHFKRFNDTYGHAVGDQVLQRVAQSVQGTLRDTELLARYGGEELAILGTRIDQRGACVIAARTRKLVEELRIEIGGKLLRVTISVGLALSSDYATPPTGAQIVADADKQLYLSKNAGRNTWSYRNRTASQIVRLAAAV